MAFTPAWRNFKRMQDFTVVAASLVYAAAVVNAVDRLPGSDSAVLQWTLLWPAAYAGFALAVPLLVTPLKNGLAKYVWMSFKAGFGQTPGSVVGGLILPLGFGLFIWWQVSRQSTSGQVGVNVFACYAAGIGILAAQAILVRALERVPHIREQIVEKG
jgi:hypothetical protein